MPAKAGIQNLMTDESIWIPASETVSQFVIPAFILDIQRELRHQNRVWSDINLI
jgi:hypothetical protein